MQLQVGLERKKKLFDTGILHAGVFGGLPAVTMTTHFAPMFSDSKNRSCLYTLFMIASLFCGAYFIGSTVIAKEYKDRLIRLEATETMRNRDSMRCKDHCRPSGSEHLPKGIVVGTSNLEMQPLWGPIENNKNTTPAMNLLALAVGIKQKEIVNRLVQKFPSKDFVVMLFHYDGVVDDWKNFTWSDHAIHVSAVNQTKWWFAKRFLHPDIVAEYSYIFLWDEDIGVENFDPNRYLSIVQGEGLEVSQPALDPVKSAIHLPITARRKNSKVHRRMYKSKGSGRCDDHSTAPPCVGWVEIMAPVFSRMAWRCVWFMIQNDLIHAWGLDMVLGYCAQGDRTQKVGVVDSEYIIHLGLPTLGVGNGKQVHSHAPVHSARDLPSTGAVASHEPLVVDNRIEVRKRSYEEMQVFRERWKNAIKEDQCWVDPFEQSSNKS
ncbi:uncharacterized protein LOC115747309 isoform X1 [Rhodamnia argentea]|uniref:Uncharacterized protein LOC115747309 isoform X1 n=2 Tax=Rhodamnia argentea TaxID=178133 RepID=A0A8B8PYC4_9MYRT|nr:uncharacterized protein LOC115747309 isoform X1 [Rhodamnia argentea]XP_048128526.1 uncharacterized protein LOC115747309 isoform X1 [Rhodamnia argentea]